MSTDDQFVLTVTADGSAELWRVAAGDRVRQLRGHTAAVLRTAFDPSGQVVMTAGADGTARAWDALTGGKIGHPLRSTTSMLAATATANGCALAVSADGTVHREPVRQGAVCRGPLPRPTDLTGAAFTPDGRFLLTVDGPQASQPELHVFDLSTGTGSDLGSSASTEIAAIAPDGSMVAQALTNGTVAVSEVASGGTPRWSLSRSRSRFGSVDSLAFSPIGGLLAVGTNHGVRIFVASTGKQSGHSSEISARVTGLAFGSAGGVPLVAAATDAGQVVILDERTGQAIDTLGGHSGAATSVAFGGTPNDRLVSAGADGTALLYPWEYIAPWPAVQQAATARLRAIEPPSASPGSSASPSAVPAKGSVTIGLMTDLSGSLSSFGDDIRASTQLAVSRLNESGGINGSPIRLVVVDTSADPTTAAAQLRSLVDPQHAVAVLGPLNSRSAQTLFPVAAGEEVPIVTGSANRDGLATVPWSFQATASNAQLYAIELPRFAQTFDVARLGLVLDNAQPGLEDAAPSVRKAAANAGIEVAGGAITIPANQTNLTDVVRQIRQKVATDGIDGLVVLSGPVEGGLLARQMAAGGVSLPVLGHPAQDSAAFFATAGIAADEWMLPSVFDPYAPARAASLAYLHDMQRLVGTSDVAPEAAIYYDLVHAIAAIAQAKGITAASDPSAARASIREGLASLRGFQGLAGSTTICPGGGSSRVVSTFLADDDLAVPFGLGSPVACHT